MLCTDEVCICRRPKRVPLLIDHFRICCLLDNWTHTYPDDFAVPGTAGALNALIKSIVGKTYLLHYGAEFIPFMETLSMLKDKDAGWAMKVDDPRDDSDDASSAADIPIRTPDSPVSSYTSHSLHEAESSHAMLQPSPSRERKSSLPLSTRMQIISNSFSGIQSGSESSNEPLTHKAILKKLVGIANDLSSMDPSTIAQEITRVECEYFLQIQVNSALFPPAILLLICPNHEASSLVATRLVPGQEGTRFGSYCEI